LETSQLVSKKNDYNRNYTLEVGANRKFILSHNFEDIDAPYFKKIGVKIVLKLMQTSSISCGGVVIFRNKVLLLYKNQHGRHMGWVLPKGNLEDGETYKAAAVREVMEESGVAAKVRKFIGKTQYSFNIAGAPAKISKTVYWYLMSTDAFTCKPQAEEYFADVGFYKKHEAYHLLKYNDERQIMTKAFTEYNQVNKLTYIREDEKNAQNM